LSEDVQQNVQQNNDRLLSITPSFFSKGEAMTKCVVCQRIPPKEVFKMTHQVLDDHLDKQTIHEIATSIMEIVHYADKKNRFVFCGKSKKTIVGSLMYLISLEMTFKPSFVNPRSGQKNAVMSQSDIARNLNITEVTIRQNYRRWLKLFPELFPTTIEKQKHWG